MAHTFIALCVEVLSQESAALAEVDTKNAMQIGSITAEFGINFLGKM
jgi:hypothetical protein